MDGLGFGVFLNPQGREIGASHQHLSRFLSLGLNLPHVDHQLLSFETVMPEALPVPVIGENVIVETSQGGTSEATCSSYTPSNSISTVSTSYQDERRMEKQVTDANYYCDKCEKDFKFEDMYAEHLRSFHKVLKPYSCHECHDTFRQKFSVNTHLRKEHNFDIPIKKAKVRKLANGMYACDLCDDIFPKLSKAYSHRLRHYPKRHVCPHCDMAFFEYKNLKKHLSVHEKPSSRSASVLGKKKKKSSRKVKLNGGVLSSKKKVFCQECEKGFHNNYSLKLHTQINHEGIKPFACSLCPSTFCVKRSLELHKLKKHKIKMESRIQRKKIGRTQTAEVAKEHLCEVCCKQFSSKYQFRVHCKTHMGESGKSFPCFLCEETFDERESVANHLKEQHNLQESNLKFPKKGPNGLYVCEDTVCLKEYAKAHDYFEHRQECHGDRRFVCPVCQKAFTKTTVFRNHFNIHNNIKPYICLVCKVSFSTRGNLNLHMRSHFKTNPFYCAACNKTYASSDTFKAHRAEHLGNSPFMCEKCYRGFKDASDLEKHIFWSHRVLKRDYKCEFCHHLFVSNLTLNRHLKKSCISIDSSKITKNICQFCGRTYKHFSTLSSHLKICEHNVHKELAENPDHPRITRKPSPLTNEDVEDIEVMVGYICKNCFFCFPEQSLLFNHVKIEHPNLKIANEIVIALYDKNNPPDFNLTDKYFSNMDKTSDNILQIRLIKYICNICYKGIPYASKSLFLKHLDNFHPKFQPEAKLLQPITITYNKESVQNPGGNIPEESKSALPEKNLRSSLRKKPRTSPKLPEKALKNDKISSKTEHSCEGTLPEKNLRRSLRTKPRTSQKLPEKALKNDKNSSKSEHSCETCGARYISENALERHVSKFHPQDLNDKENGTYCSDDSDKKSEDSNEKIEQSCKICKIVYSKKYFLDKHIASYHPDYDDPQPKSYVVNLTMTMDSMIKPAECFQCSICSVTYSRRHNLENHVRKQHLKEILLKTSPSELNIDDYIESSSSGSKSTYLACDVCQERYKVKRYLEAHIRKKHPDHWKEYEGKEQRQKTNDIDPDDPVEEEFNPDVEYYCKICRLPYNLKKNLERHVENFHPDYYQIYPEDKPFEEKVIFEPNIQKPDVLLQLAEITKNLDPPRKDQAENISGYYPEGGLCSFKPLNQNISLPTKNPTLSGVNFDKPTYIFNDTVTPVNQFASASNLNPSEPGTYFQRVIPEPVNYGYANQNTNYEVASFNNGAPKTDFGGNNHNYTPANNQPASDQHNSGDEDCRVPDSGFDVNYDSDTCDDPTELKDDKINLDDNGLLEQNKPLNSSSIRSVLTEPEKAKGYFCKICRMYYLRKSFLKTHYLKKHPTEKNLVEELNMEIEIEKNNVNHFCEICSKQFNRKDSLTRHYQNLHIREPINTHKTDLLQQLVEITKDLDPPRKDQSQNTISEYQPEGGVYSLKPSYQNLSQPSKNPTLSFVNLDKPSVNLDKPTDMFDNAATAINQFNFNPSQPVTNFQRVITEPVNYGYANQNMIYEVASFNNQPASDQQNSENEDCGVPDSGFDVNYDSDTCDDPKELQDDKINLDDNGLLEQNTPLEGTPLNDNSSEVRIVLTETEKAKGYFCKICPMYYLRKIYLKTHYSKEHPSEKKLFEELSKEIEIEENKKANIRFICEICSKPFARKDLLARHHQNVHLRNRCFSCDICKATFTSNDNLKSHNEIHIKNTYLCATCLECFKTKELLDEHENFHVNGVPCPECKVSFSKTFLRRHFKKRHPELKYEEIVESEDDKKSVKKRRKGKRRKTDESEDNEENNSDTTKESGNVKSVCSISKPKPKRNAKRVKKRQRKSKIDESEDTEENDSDSTKAGDTDKSTVEQETTPKTEPKRNPKRVKKGLRKTDEIDDSDEIEDSEERKEVEGSGNSTKLRNKKLKTTPKRGRKGLRKIKTAKEGETVKATK